MATEKQLAALRKARAAKKRKRSGAVVVSRVHVIGGSKTWGGGAHPKDKIGHGKYAHLTYEQLHNLEKAWAARRGTGKAKGKSKHGKRGRPAFQGPVLPSGWKRVTGKGGRLGVSGSGAKRCGRPKGSKNKTYRVKAADYSHLSPKQRIALQKAWNARRAKAAAKRAA